LSGHNFNAMESHTTTCVKG